MELNQNQESRWLDPGALMKLKSLELQVKVVVEGFLLGLHRSPFHGFSAEFSEYRPYVDGEDTRYLDWKLYARTDRNYIKKVPGGNQRPHLFSSGSEPVHGL